LQRQQQQYTLVSDSAAAAAAAAAGLLLAQGQQHQGSLQAQSIDMLLLQQQEQYPLELMPAAAVAAGLRLAQGQSQQQQLQQQQLALVADPAAAVTAGLLLAHGQRHQHSFQAQGIDMLLQQQQQEQQRGQQQHSQQLVQQGQQWLHAKGRQHNQLHANHLIPQQVLTDLEAWRYELAMLLDPPEPGQPALSVSAAWLLCRLPLPASVQQYFGSTLAVLRTQVEGVSVYGGSNGAMVSLSANTNRSLRRQAVAAGRPLQPSQQQQQQPLQQEQQQQQEQRWLCLPQLTVREQEQIRQWLLQVATAMDVTFPPKRIMIDALKIRAPPRNVFSRCLAV
jgi:hypothetical protein